LYHDEKIISPNKTIKCLFYTYLKSNFFGFKVMLFASQTPTVDLSNTKIAFTLNENNGDFIWVMDHDGSNKMKLTQGVTPCWSPDGQQIAFAAEKNANWDIYYMNADGTDITRLTTHVAEDVYPSWSPDGSMIAFNSERSGSSQIWRMNVRWERGRNLGI
jgi:Tol biopolymer transport system component